MGVRRDRFTALAVLLGGAALFPAPAADAAPAPPPSCGSGTTVESIRLTPDHAAAGAPLRVAGTGFCTCPSRVDVRVELFALGSMTVEDGAFGLDTAVPPGLPAGPHDVEAECSDHVDFASAPLTVDPPAAAPPAVATVRLDPARAAAGTTVRVTGSGFDHCVLGTHDAVLHPDVRIGLDARPAGTVPLDARRGFAAELTVPGNLPAGTHRVTAECGDPDGGPGVAGARAGADLLVVVPGPGGSGAGSSGTGRSGAGGPGPAGPGSGGPGTGGPGTGGPGSGGPGGPGVAPAAPAGSGAGGAGGVLLTGLGALALAALAAPLLRRLEARGRGAPGPAWAASTASAAGTAGAASAASAAGTSGPTRAVTVDAVFAGRPGPPPRLRETGADRSVAVRVVGHADPGTRTVRWREGSGS